MKKLSKAQRYMLEKLANGDTLHYLLLGGESHGFYSKELDSNVPRSRIHFKTIAILVERGLIKNIEDEAWHWRGHKYIITEKGQHILKKDERT